MIKNVKKSEKMYYIKNNGKVIRVSQDKYEEFKSKLQKLNKIYLCPNCKECTCEKIKFSNINACEEVNTAAYKSYNESYVDTVTGEKKVRREVDEFLVFDCDKFNLYSNLVMDENNNVFYRGQVEREQQKMEPKILTNKEILDKVREKVRKENEKKLTYKSNN